MRLRMGRAIAKRQIPVVLTRVFWHMLGKLSVVMPVLLIIASVWALSALVVASCARDVPDEPLFV